MVVKQHVMWLACSKLSYKALLQVSFVWPRIKHWFCFAHSITDVTFILDWLVAKQPRTHILLITRTPDQKRNWLTVVSQLTSVFKLDWIIVSFRTSVCIMRKKINCTNCALYNGSGVLMKAGYNQSLAFY